MLIINLDDVAKARNLCNHLEQKKYIWSTFDDNHFFPSQFYIPAEKINDVRQHISMFNNQGGLTFEEVMQYLECTLH